MAEGNVRGMLATVSWLAENLDDPHLVVLDAVYAMPGAVTSAAEAYRASHIPTAQFFDIDAVADGSTDLPHMVPTAEQFETHARALGISKGSRIVVYDRPGLMSAGRVWWIFRLFGHDDIAVLDGGFRKWQAEDRPVTAVVTERSPGDFEARMRPALVRSKSDMLANLASAGEQVVDARSAARFTAAEEEPRKGLRRGHIPGSRNLPFSLLTNPETGELKPAAEIAALFAEAGIDAARPIVTTCGTGVTAGALAFALGMIDARSVAVYDGSWAEWGLPGDTPVEC